MRHCTRCVIPDARPGIQFDFNGVCFPCLAAERAKTIDWAARRRALEELCDRHRDKHRRDPYDCIIPVSGGKDSHVQADLLRNILGMRPLLVSVGNWFQSTKAGEENFRNLCAATNCDSLLFRQSPELMREMVCVAFFEVGSPTWPIDAAIYAAPLRLAQALGIELIVYGENVAATYGGPCSEETPSARQQIKNDVVKPLNADWWWARGIELPGMLTYPLPRIADALEPIYLGYYVPWSGWQNKEAAIRLGFRTAAGEWHRGGCIEDYDQIDTKGYMVHPWLKYPKFGHARATDVASSWIREGRITRDQGVDLVLANDHVLDEEALRDFLAFTGIGHRQFWAHVDTLYNRDIFVKEGGQWKLKEPVRKMGACDYTHSYGDKE